MASANSLVERIRNDRKHGASELARNSLAGLAEMARNAKAKNPADLKRQLEQLAHELQRTRPTMAPITNLIERWLAAFSKTSTGELDTVRAQAVICAQALIAESEQAVEKAAVHASEIIGSNKTIMTHSLSSTVIGVFEILGKGAKAIVTESRPPGEGRRLAERLSALGIATDFISDQQMGLFVQHADVALVGADTVAADGSVINKAGSILLALAARERGIPFYACFESFKCSKLATAEIPLESHDPAELDLPALPHVTPHNIYFDITPARLITAWVTETGVSSEFSFEQPSP